MNCRTLLPSCHTLANRGFEIYSGVAEHLGFVAVSVERGTPLPTDLHSPLSTSLAFKHQPFDLIFTWFAGKQSGATSSEVPRSSASIPGLKGSAIRAINS